MTRIADLQDRLRRLAKRRDAEGIYTDANLVEAAAARIAELEAEIERTKKWYLDAIEQRDKYARLWDEALSRTGAVKVKALEWVDADEGMCTKWRAAALGGHYELVDFGKDDPGFAVNFHWGRPLSFWFIQGEHDERGPTGPKMFPTLDAAKAAAQADCERRILSALEPAAPEGRQEVVAWQNIETLTSILTPDQYAMRLPHLAHCYRPLYTRPAEQAVTEAALRDAARRIVPYLRWTISDESPGHHPTMPSAVGAFMTAFGWGTEEKWREDQRTSLKGGRS